jgi:hypothetical protein
VVASQVDVELTERRGDLGERHAEGTHGREHTRTRC